MMDLGVVIWIGAALIAFLVIWAQLRTADEVAKIRKLLEGEIKKGEKK